MRPQTLHRNLATSLYMFGDSNSIPTHTSTDGNILTPRNIPTDSLSTFSLGSDLSSTGGWDVKGLYCGKGAATAIKWSKEGEDDKLTMHSPSLPQMGANGILELNMKEVIDVSLGVKHAIAVGTCADTNSVVAKSWGWAGGTIEGYGVLGLGGDLGGESGVVGAPTDIESLREDGTPLDMVSCSGIHTVGLCEGTNEVLTTGSGQYGRLGNVDATDQLFFEPVELLMTLPDTKFRKITTGNSYTMVMSEDGGVWSWGKVRQGRELKEGWTEGRLEGRRVGPNDG